MTNAEFDIVVAALRYGIGTGSELVLREARRLERHFVAVRDHAKAIQLRCMMQSACAEWLEDTVRKEIENALASCQQPLGEEFEKVLHDNLLDLYVKS